MNELAPRSLGGGRLCGTKIVRIVYMDEAGRGRLDEEPYFVVACAITSPDSDWHRIARHYADLANDIFDLPNDAEDAFERYVFQAKKVWHGSGDFSRSRFTTPDRMKILKRLAMVPAQYNIPISVAIIDRAVVRKHYPNEAHALSIEHANAYALALQYVDTWMAENCPGEVASITAEDVDSVRSTIRQFHEGLQKHDRYDDYWDRGAFVTKSIVEPVSFVPKDLSPILQMADHCAYIAKRAANGCKFIGDIWSVLKPQVLSKNKHSDAKLRVAIPLDDLEPC